MDSDLQTFPVEKNDLIILGSDGIYDVMSDSKIEDVVNKRDLKVYSFCFSFLCF